MPFEFEYLLTIGPIEIVLQFATDREGALLQPPVRLVGRMRDAKIVGASAKARHARVRLKEGLDGLSSVGLIVFEGPHLVRAGSDNLDGQVALG